MHQNRKHPHALSSHSLMTLRMTKNASIASLTLAAEIEFVGYFD